MQHSLGILGCGVAARTIGAGLVNCGPHEVRLWKRRPWDGAVEKEVQSASAILCDDVAEVVGPSHVIFSLVTPAAALEVAKAAAPHAAGKYYVDLNAVSLKSVVEAGQVIEAAAGHFVDGAIMGPLAKQKHQVSTLVSGPHAAELADILRGWEMNVRSIGERVGLASTVKMIRSVYTKGLEAVVVECMAAAHRYGATDEVLESLAEILELGPFLLPIGEMTTELVLEQVDHAARRAEEMEQVVKTLNELNIEPAMSSATLATLSSAAERLAGLDELKDKTKRQPGAVLDALLHGGVHDR